MSRKSYLPSAAQASASAVRVPHLAEEQPEVGDGDLVEGLEGAVELVGTDLEAPGVGGDPGNFAAVQPGGGAEGQPGRGPPA